MSEITTRPTHEFTTPQNHKVVVKDYLTAREVNAVITDIFKGQEVSSGDTAPKISLAVGVMRNVKLVEAAVLSLDDSTENISERIQDLPMGEYTAILKEVQGLADGNF